VEHLRRALLEREQGVERRDAIRLRRRDVEAARRIAERAGRHPANAPLGRAKRREQELAAVAVAARDPPVLQGLGTDDGVDRSALGLRRQGVDELEIRQQAPSGSQLP
jgi:hypothetical protein